VNFLSTPPLQSFNVPQNVSLNPVEGGGTIAVSRGNPGPKKKNVEKKNVDKGKTTEKKEKKHNQCSERGPPRKRKIHLQL